MWRETESLILPPIYNGKNNKMPQSPPIVAVRGTGGDGPTESLISPGPPKYHEYKLHNKMPCALLSTVCRLVQKFHRPPKIPRFGGDGEIFSLICPPQPQNQVGAAEHACNTTRHIYSSGSYLPVWCWGSAGSHSSLGSTQSSNSRFRFTPRAFMDLRVQQFFS